VPTQQDQDVSDVVEDLVDENIRTEWRYGSTVAEADDDATDPGDPTDATDADDDASDADDDASDADDDATDT
jgi:hypothetical protein